MKNSPQIESTYPQLKNKMRGDGCFLDSMRLKLIFVIEKIIGALLMTSLLLIQSGCGKDQSVDDYRQRKVSEEISHLEKIVGTYRGQLHDASDGSDMGEITFNLTYTIVPVNSSDGSTTASQAYVTGKVSLASIDQSDAGIQQADYNWRSEAASGNFSGKIPIGTLADGMIAQLNITGTLNASEFIGQIEPNGVSGKTAIFHATKVDDASKEEKKPAKPVDPGSLRRVSSYSGYFDFPGCSLTSSDCLRLATMDVVETNVSSSLRFYHYFVLEKTISVTINIWMPKSKMNIDTTSFEAPEGSAKLDQRSPGAIHAKTITSSGGTSKRVFYLECSRFESVVGGNKINGWSCIYSGPNIPLEFRLLPSKN